MTPLEAAVLQVLSWQSSGYLCSPDASAFKSQGLEDFEEIEKALISLQDEGYVEFYTDEKEIDIIQVEKDEDGKPVIDEETGGVKPILDNEGNLVLETVTQIEDTGWIITDKGRTEL
jgi:hypothetical protein